MFVDGEERDYDIIKEIFTDTWNSSIEELDLMVTLNNQPILRLCIYRLVELNTINNIWCLIVSNDYKLYLEYDIGKIAEENKKTISE